MVDIPPEIITEILYRLSVRSLGRFKCVSKSCLAQISEPHFIKHHLKLTRLIYDSYNGSIFTLPFNHLHDKPNLSLTFPKAHSFVFHGSCNGLVLLSAVLGSPFSNKFRNTYNLIILNPTTKEHIKLPIAPVNEVFDSYTDYTCGFGYDSSINDYKVVTLISSWHERKYYMYVYSLKNNTWRWVIDYSYHHSKQKYMSCVFVDGFLHWIAVKRSIALWVIVSFSLADETFSEAPSPDLGVDVDYKLIVVGEKLGMFVKDGVWLMNEYGVRESWSKIGIHGLEFMNNVETKIFYEDGIIVFGSRNLVRVYDVERKVFRESVYAYNDIKYFFLRGAYVESLVSPKFSSTNQKSTSSVEDSHVEL